MVRVFHRATRGVAAMEGQVVARFLVDRPIRPGMVRAILDTLSAQGGAYAPQLVRRSGDDSLRRIAGARPAGLLDEVGEGGTQTTFLRVAEAHPHPVLSFSVSPTPRTRPTSVTLTVPADSLGSSKEIEQLLGVCKGLYLFLEAAWGVAGLEEPVRSGPRHLGWANFFGPDLVARLGPARLLTSVAFIVEILPDGGMMLVTHPSPEMATSPEGVALRLDIEQNLGLEGVPAALLGRGSSEDRTPRRTPRETSRSGQGSLG